MDRARCPPAEFPVTTTFVDVETVLFGVPVDPPKGATAILDRGRCMRDVGQAIRDVDDGPPHLEIGQEGQG